MVKLTSDLIIRHGSHSKKQNYESDFQFLRRLTHVYCQEKHIDEITNLEVCRSLNVLYLYDNSIRSIKNLSSMGNLTHLYLQKNQISRINGLNGLSRLQKLYLGHNSITVVEGLENVESLTELHIENQSLPPGESLLFDPRTMEALSHSLSILNVSGNNLTEISELAVLSKLTQFFAANNQFHHLYDLSCAVRSWTSISRLELSGNPFCQSKKYRDKVILMSKRLVMLDGKEVSEATRLFLQSWQANKEMKKTAQKQRKDTTDFVVHLTQKDVGRQDLGVHREKVDMHSLTAEGSYFLPQSIPLTKPNKRLLAKGKKRSEGDDSTGIKVV